MNPPVVSDQVLVREESFITLITLVLPGGSVDRLLVVTQRPHVREVFATQTTQVTVELALQSSFLRLNLDHAVLVNTLVVVPELLLVDEALHAQRADQTGGAGPLHADIHVLERGLHRPSENTFY